MSQLIRILIVDDHPVVRQGLAGLLVPRNGMEVVGEATDGREAVALARKLQPDVIMMDMVMPDMNGIEATKQIRADNPVARILVLTSFGDASDLIEVINAGALGCLLKDSKPDDLLHAIRSVNRGQMSIPQSLAVKLLSEPAQPRSSSSLSAREREIASLVKQGQSNREIAEQLVLSPNTVRTHISNILRKLQLANRTQLAVYSLDSD